MGQALKPDAPGGNSACKAVSTGYGMPPAAAPGRPAHACPARHLTSPTRRPADRAARCLVAGWVVAHGWWLMAGTWLGVSKRLAVGSDEGIAACLRRREHRLGSGEDGAPREAWCRRGAGCSGLLRSRKEGTGASTRRSRRLQALGVGRGVRRHSQNLGRRGGDAEKESSGQWLRLTDLPQHGTLVP